MKLEKAIEILEAFIPRQWWQEPYKVKDATKLGLEAMKRVKDIRSGKVTMISIPLPGETKGVQNEPR